MDPSRTQDAADAVRHPTGTRRPPAARPADPVRVAGGTHPGEAGARCRPRHGAGIAGRPVPRAVHGARRTLGQVLRGRAAALLARARRRLLDRRGTSRGTSRPRTHDFWGDEE